MMYITLQIGVMRQAIEEAAAVIIILYWQIDLKRKAKTIKTTKK